MFDDLKAVGRLPLILLAVALWSTTISRAAEPENKTSAGVSENSAEERIRKALNQQTKFEFSETPLAEVVGYFQKEHKIPIQLDNKALTELGIGADTPITRSLSGVKLKSALKLILRDLDLYWVIRDEVLLITSSDVAASQLIDVVYDVHDITDKGSVDTLVKTITEIVAPQSWNAVGGPGAIAPLEVSGTRAMVISQTQEVHETLNNLLAELRKLPKRAE